MTTERDIILHPTPLHERTTEHSRTNEWTGWHGFSVPSVFGTVSEEARALTRHVGLADYSPRPALALKGPDAAGALDRMLTRRVSDMEPGDLRDALMCVRTGHVIDRCSIARFEDDEFAVLADSHIGARAVHLSKDKSVDVSASVGAVIGVLGAERSKVLNATGVNAPSGENGFATRLSARGIDVEFIDVPSRSITLLRVSEDDAAVMWGRLAKRQTETSVLPVGMAAQERFRIDQGMPAAGKEFVPAIMAREDQAMAFPLDLGWGALVEHDGRAFAGASALAELPQSKRLVWLETSRPFDLKGGRILQGGMQVGHVTSCYAAPEHGLARAIGVVSMVEEGVDLKLETINGTITPTSKCLS